MKQLHQNPSFLSSVVMRLKDTRKLHIQDLFQLNICLLAAPVNKMKTWTRRQYGGVTI